MQCHPPPRDSAMDKSNTVLTMQTTRQQPAHPSSIQSTSLLLASCNLCHECRHHLHELIISTAVFDTLLITPSTLFADRLLPLQLLPPTLLVIGTWSVNRNARSVGGRSCSGSKRSANSVDGVSKSVSNVPVHAPSPDDAATRAARAAPSAPDLYSPSPRCSQSASVTCATIGHRPRLCHASSRSIVSCPSIECCSCCCRCCGCML